MSDKSGNAVTVKQPHSVFLSPTKVARLSFSSTDDNLFHAGNQQQAPPGGTIGGPSCSTTTSDAAASASEFVAASAHTAGDDVPMHAQHDQRAAAHARRAPSAGVAKAQGKKRSPELVDVLLTDESKDADIGAGTRGAARSAVAPSQLSAALHAVATTSSASAAAATPALCGTNEPLATGRFAGAPFSPAALAAAAPQRLVQEQQEESAGALGDGDMSPDSAQAASGWEVVSDAGGVAGNGAAVSQSPFGSLKQSWLRGLSKLQSPRK